MSSTAQRSGHWDRWKGIAIIAVIAIHSSGATADKSHAVWAHDFTLVFRQIVNFAVPLFLTLAGYFAARSWREGAVQYWRNRGWRILPAYLIWTVIAIALLKPWHFRLPRELVADFAFGTGIEVGYFVIVLVQNVLLVPLLARLRSRGQHLVVMIATTGLGLAFSYAMQSTYAAADWAKFPFYCLPFFVWAPFFQLGFWAARNSDSVRPRDDSRWLLFAGAASLAAIAEGFFWDAKGLFLLGTSQIKVTSFTASVFVALHVIALRERKYTSKTAVALEWVGRNSYLIYLSHMIFLPTVTLAIRTAAPMLYQFRPMALLSVTALTVVICAAVALLARAATRPAIHRDLLGAG